jgi:hypothetical protein
MRWLAATGSSAERLLMNRFVLPAGVLAAMTVGAIAAPLASAEACDSFQGDNVAISSAKNLSCAKAKKEMDRYTGSISKNFSTPGNFKCKRKSGSKLSGTWKCTKGDKSFKFVFSD